MSDMLTEYIPAGPSRATWELIMTGFQLFPLFTAAQWLTDWYPLGKTSIRSSKLNLPGKYAWAIMETPGMLTLAWMLFTIPSQENIALIPWGNKTMAGLYFLHYIYRAYAFAYFAPSISPIHLLPFLGAIAFNTINGICIGGWLAGYGPTSELDWRGSIYRVEIGLVVFGWSLLGNMFHDDDLREIRRAAARRQIRLSKETGRPAEQVDKVYVVPRNGLFHFVLYAHYLCEWFEWLGFWIIGGPNCVPARTFLINEISTMLPRALAGKRWYLKNLGAEKVNGRKAIIPGIL